MRYTTHISQSNIVNNLKKNYYFVKLLTFLQKKEALQYCSASFFMFLLKF